MKSLATRPSEYQGREIVYHFYKTLVCCLVSQPPSAEAEGLPLSYQGGINVRYVVIQMESPLTPSQELTWNFTSAVKRLLSTILQTLSQNVWLSQFLQFINPLFINHNFSECTRVFVIFVYYNMSCVCLPMLSLLHR